MVAKTYINDNGTWRTVRAIYVNDGTAWRTVKSQWVNDNGTWRQVHRGVFVYNETITANASNYDLRSKLTTAGWDGTQDVEATITINPGVIVYSTTTPTAAFTINPALPPASTVSLTNQGTIVGKAGTGGNGGSYFPTQILAGAGISGGSGLYTTSPISINNTGGVIAGGGGGGGGGGVAAASYSLSYMFAGGSGGGGGGGSSSPGGSPTPGGQAGIVSPIPPAYPTPVTGYANGSVGSSGTNDAGGQTSGITVFLGVLSPANITSGFGGAGGARGNSGSTGGTGSSNPAGPAPQWGLRDFPAGGAGGTAGAAISGNPLVTLPVPQTGTISGPRV